MSGDAARYSDWKLLGKGGTAVVYSVMDRQLEERVAIKVLRPAVAADLDNRSMLRQEVLSSRRLRHPNIVAVHDFYEGDVPNLQPGQSGFGVVMDIIPGVVELKDWMDENRDRLLETSRDRLDVLIRTFEALEIAHSYLVHRDLKPQNIMLSNGDIRKPVIMDFGLAVPSAESGGLAGLTTKYASPEQWLDFPLGGNLPDIVIDARSDLFTMGVIAYELFTNRVPEQSIKGRVNHSTGELSPSPQNPPTMSDFNASVPAALGGLVADLMQDDPALRPASAAKVLQVLRKISLLDADLQGGRSAERLNVSVGQFVLGAGPKETKNFTEKPQRRVLMDTFLLDIQPVTNRAYREFLDKTGYARPPYIDDPFLGADGHPVVGVTWDDAGTYAEYVGGKLPTEAQWEYAAKGGEKVVYPWGDEPWDPTRANIDRSQKGTTAVDRYPQGKNSLGLWDLTGNVWEWCLDTWAADFYKSLSHGVTNPANLKPGAEKSVRGGAFNVPQVMGRCSSRFHYPADTRNPAVGFRVAYAAEQSA